MSCFGLLKRLAPAWVIALLTAATVPAQQQGPAEVASGVSWSNGPPSDPRFFPIAVWLQDPKNAPRYQAIGVNL
jgi:hypothetical protein